VKAVLILFVTAYELKCLPICGIVKQHQNTHTLKWHYRKSAYQAPNAAFFRLKPAAICGVSQKGALCYPIVLPPCFEKAELKTTPGSGSWANSKKLD